MATRTLAITKTSTRAKHPDQTYPRVAGSLPAVAIARHEGFVYSAGFKAAIDSTDWDDVREVTAATLTLRTPATPALYFDFGAPVTGRLLLTRLRTRDFPDNNEDDFEDAYQDSDRNYVKATSDWPTLITPQITKGGETVHNINIIKFLRAWAPTSVRFRIGGKTYKGLNRDNHGFVAERMDSTQAVIASEEHPDVDLRPEIVFTYETKPSASTVFVTGPTSPIVQAEEEYFEGDLVATKTGEKIERIHIQLYKATVDTGDYDDEGSEALWDAKQEAESSEVELGSFSVPLTDAVSGSLKWGITQGAYKWRVRLQTPSGWTAWSAAQTLNVDASAPTLSNLTPNDSYDDLNGVEFSARVTNTNLIRDASGVATSVRKLVSYRIQVMPDTPPDDPAWDEGPFLWDTSDRPATQSDRKLTLTGSPVTSGYSTFSTPYGGAALTPGWYSYRMKATDEMGAESDWEYDVFEVLVGEQPDPGETEFLTGYSRRKTKARIVIKGITHNTQRIKVKATGGDWRVTFSGDQTADLAHNISAANLKTAIEGLSGVDTLDSVTVDTSVAGQRTYTVVFRASGQLAEANTPLFELDDIDLTGSDHALTLTSGSNRGPNRQVAVIYDAANIGASGFWNSPGEFFFTLPATHPQVSVIEPYQVHYSLQHYQGEGWVEKAAGLIIDFDASDEDVVFYGTDYLGVLAGGFDERLTDNPDAQAKLYPDTGGGSKYVDRTVTQIVTDQLDRAIHHANSPVGFISRGTIATMSEEVTIFSTFKSRLDFIAGLIDTHRGANPGLKTRLRVRKTAASGYQFRVEDNPGKDRDNLGIQYGRLVQGFRLIAFGNFKTRTLAIGFPVEGSEPIYLKDITGGVDENLYGRWPSPRLWQDIDGKADLKRRATLDARQNAKVGKRVAIGFRVDALGLLDGWDICDNLKIDIRRGVVDTNRYGSSYWTVWGWAWQLFPDGHSDLTLSILPRDDTADPDTDLIPAKPINVTKEWDVQELGGAAPASFSVLSSEIERDDGSIETFVSVAEQGVPALRVLDSDTGVVWVPEADVDGSLTGDYVTEQEITAASAIESEHALTADVADIANDIIDGVLDQANFVSTLRVPIIFTGTLPTLPDANYPNGQLLYRTNDTILYKNENGTWEAAAMTSDIVAGTIVAGAVAAGAVATALISLKMNPQDAGSGFQNHATAPSVTITPSGIIINNGAIVLKDEFGSTALQASGFVGSWQEYLQLGLYNALLKAGIVGTIPAGRGGPLGTNPETYALPYWTLSNDTGSPVAVFRSGGGVRVSFAATGNIKKMVSDPFKIIGSTDQPLIVIEWEWNFQAASTAQLEIEAYIEYSPDDTFASVSEGEHIVDGVLRVINGVTGEDRTIKVDAGAQFSYGRLVIEIKQLVAHHADNWLQINSAAVRYVPYWGGDVYIGEPGSAIALTRSSDPTFVVDGNMLISGAIATTRPPEVTKFTANGTWNKPSDVTYIVVEVVGGGGGGGGAASGADVAVAGGGGGGGYARRLFTADELVSDSTYTVTRGAGGAGGAAGNNNGSAGNTSSFAGTGITTVQATGGGGGDGQANGTGIATAAGGLAGIGSGDADTIGVEGSDGTMGIRHTGTQYVNGDGGASGLGFGGAQRGNATDGGGAGSNGNQYGGGGAGGHNGGGAGAFAGGDGANGVVIVTAYFGP